MAAARPPRLAARRPRQSSLLASGTYRSSPTPRPARRLVSRIQGHQRDARHQARLTECADDRGNSATATSEVRLPASSSWPLLPGHQAQVCRHDAGGPRRRHSAASCGLWAVASGSGEAGTVASLAKAYCCDASRQCASGHARIPGGIGLIWRTLRACTSGAPGPASLCRRPELPPRATRDPGRDLTSLSRISDGRRDACGRGR